jgi:hypothetical protein
MANSRIVAGKQGDQRFVLAHGDARQTPEAAISFAGHTKACARDRRVVGPGIVPQRIEQPGQFREQSFIRVL